MLFWALFSFLALLSYDQFDKVWRCFQKRYSCTWPTSTGHRVPVKSSSPGNVAGDQHNTDGSPFSLPNHPKTHSNYAVGPIVAQSLDIRRLSRSLPKQTSPTRPRKTWTALHHDRRRDRGPRLAPRRPCDPARARRSEKPTATVISSAMQDTTNPPSTLWSRSSQSSQTPWPTSRPISCTCS